MKSKGLLTASFLLLVLSGVIWWSNKKAVTPEKAPVETTTVKLLNLPEDQIQDIEIKKRTGETIQLKRNDSKWMIAGAEPLRADPDAVSSMQWGAEKEIIAVGWSKDEWQIVKAKPFRADRSQVEDLLRALRDVKMDLSGSEDEKKAAAAFRAGTAFATVRVTDVSGAQELQVRKNKDDYYAKSSAVVGVYKISRGTGAGLDKGLDDFRNKKLFDFDFAEPEKIEIHDGSKSYFLTR